MNLRFWAGGMRDGRPQFSSHLPEVNEYIVRVCRHKLQEERLRKLEACEEPLDEELECEGTPGSSCFRDNGT